MDDIIVRVIDFPNTDVKGIVGVDENGDYNVYLNAKYTSEQNALTYLHEKFHIDQQHLYSYRPVEELEKEADQCHYSSRKRKSL